MNEQSNINFNRIQKAIEFLDANYKQQPSLDEVAAYVHLSPTHFQRIFTEWAGVSPKQFLQYTTAAHAKSLLKLGKESLLSSSTELGLSSSSRLHDLFVSIEAMTPGEYRNGGASLVINYSFANTFWGNVLVASTTKGICHLSFVESHELGLVELQDEYPNAIFNEESDSFQEKALSFLSGSEVKFLPLHLRGTEFQLKVWEALLKIPFGELVSYGDLSTQIGNPKASRAVGSAIGSNPVAYLIPCHRVIQSTGLFGGYKWDLSRKKAIIGWESAHGNKK